MIRIREAIVVEGRYDKNTLSQLVDAPIFETSGFGVMNNRELLTFLREVARRRGLIILTDSDGAGFVIRNYLKGALPKEQILHAYIPDVFGKERRKRQAGKEGKLGVEGMTAEILLAALRDAGAHIEGETAQAAGEPISKLDLFELGFSGTADSSNRRAALKRELSLPEHLSTNGLLDALNVLFRREEFLERYKRSNP